LSANWGPIAIIQTSFEKPQFKRRWSVVSSACRQRGHLKGPSHPRLLRFSPVWMLLCAKVQMKRSIFGRELDYQIAFQSVGLGIAVGTLLKSW
jgi:hypothetical protein